MSKVGVSAALAAVLALGAMAPAVAQTTDAQAQEEQAQALARSIGAAAAEAQARGGENAQQAVQAAVQQAIAQSGASPAVAQRALALALQDCTVRRTFMPELACSGASLAALGSVQQIVLALAGSPAPAATGGPVGGAPLTAVPFSSGGGSSNYQPNT
jgi:hypothetical protein